jgi:hypothetical protein
MLFYPIPQKMQLLMLIVSSVVMANLSLLGSYKTFFLKLPLKGDKDKSGVSVSTTRT